MTKRTCPECGGAGKDIELIDKFEKAECRNSKAVIWESRCACCRGRGYILFGMTYPTAAQFRESYVQWRETEIIPQRVVQIERIKDPEYRREMEEVKNRHKERVTRQEAALISRMKKALRIAIERVERM